MTPAPERPTDHAIEHHIRVPRTARYRVLGDPASADEVWFVLHGYRQLAERFIRRFEALPGVGGTRAVVAPEALSRFYIEREVGRHGPASRVGATWMTRADREHEIRDYVEYLDRVAEAVLGPSRPESGEAGAAVRRTGSARVVVLGFSQGAETASRWAVLGETRPAELVLWGGGTATDLEPALLADALRGVRLRLVVGSDDGWAERRSSETVAAFADARKGAGAGGTVPVERIDYPGGHAIDAETLRRHWPAPGVAS